MLFFKSKNVARLITFGIFVWFYSPLIVAQNDSSLAHIEIHTNPLTYLYFIPSYRLGAEYAKNRFGYVLEYGFGNTALNGYRFKAYSDKEGQSYLYQSVRGEFKYYFKPLQNGKNVYLATEMFFLQATDVFHNSYYIPETQTYYEEYSFTKADFLHQKYGVHFKVGGKRIIKNRVILDAYMGVGVIQFVVDYSNIENPAPSDMAPSEQLPLYPDYSKETNSTRLNFVIGLKIGSIVWKQKH